MSRRANASLLALCVCVSFAGAQAAPEAPAPDDSPAGSVESYLRARGLRTLLADHLLAQLEKSSGRDRVAVAERLGRVYAELLSETDSQARRDALMSASADLLARVPGADTFDLRIALLRARYVPVEESAERVRLRLVDEDERRATLEALESIGAAMGLLSDRAARRVEAIERRERSGGVSDLPSLRAELAEARRERSLAKYYAGWANYYTALLTGSPALAEKAVREFAFLLGSEGIEPTVDRMPRSLLRYEHVARAAVGVALSEALRGRAPTGALWLDELEKSEDTHPAVLAQLFSRRVTVLASGRRWDALSRVVERRREARLDERATSPLRTGEARLLAVEVLEALRAPDSDAARREAAEPLVRAALGDLIARGESAQVLDLVERYGTLPIGDEGFIARYVRALRAYRAARELHAASGEDDSLPTRAPELVAAYLTASDLLTHAFESVDAGAFSDDRHAAGMMLGMALYYKDSPAQAAERFEQAARLAPPGPRHAEALWMSVVAFERATEQGRADLTSRLHASAVLFVQGYPRDERSARLLLRFADAGLFDRETAVSVLLAVGRDSPLYLASRRHAADVLYRAYAGAGEPARSELAARFLPIAFECIEHDLRLLRDPAARGGDASPVERVVVRARQALDASLTPIAGDAESARRAFAAIQEARVRAGFTPSEELIGELAYRRLQQALLIGDDAARDSAHRELEAIGGRFLDAADRFLFSRAADRWQRTGDPADARRVLDIGRRLLNERAIDRALLTIADTTARAATALREASGDRDALRTAIDLDRRVLASHAPTAELLRRLARNAEDEGDLDLAFEAWTRLSVSIREGERDWFEARYESIRVLARTSPEKAREALRQHRVLYPLLAPSPWDQRFEELEQRLRAEGGKGASP